MLTIMDTFSRFSLPPRFTFRSSGVLTVVERACNEVGSLATIHVDQDSEFVSRDIYFGLTIAAAR
ncbi:hypothetical protein [Bradyrhizobium sp. 5.13L]